MIHIDYEEWPIVHVRPPRTVEDEELAEFLHSFSVETKTRGGGCVVVLDLRRCEKLSVAQRELMTEHMAEMDSLDLLRGCAMVFRSRLLKGIMTAMFWVYRPRYPTRVFNSVGDASTWASLRVDVVRPTTIYPPKSAPPVDEESPVEDEIALRPRPPSSSPRMAPPRTSSAPERRPRDSAWILHLDASRNRTQIEEQVEALIGRGADAFVCEREVSSEFSLWVGWMGPYSNGHAAFSARDELAKREGIALTVSQWSDDPHD